MKKIEFLAASLPYDLKVKEINLDMENNPNINTESLEFYLSLNYEIYVERTDEDGNGDYIFVAYCKEIGEGCYGIGKTFAKAVIHFIEVKNELIKRYYEQGRVIHLPQN